MLEDYLLITMLCLLSLILFSELIIRNSYVIKTVTTTNVNDSEEINYKLYERSFRKEGDPIPKIKKTPFLYEPDEEDFSFEFPGSPFE